MGILLLNFLKRILIQNIRAEQVLPLLLATLQLFSWFAFCKTRLYAVLAVNGLHNHLYIILIFFGRCILYDFIHQVHCCRRTHAADDSKY